MYLWGTDVQLYSSVAHGTRELPVHWVNGEEESGTHWEETIQRPCNWASHTVYICMQHIAQPIHSHINILYMEILYTCRLTGTGTVKVNTWSLGEAWWQGCPPQSHPSHPVLGPLPLPAVHSVGQVQKGYKNRTQHNHYFTRMTHPSSVNHHGNYKRFISV